MLAIDPQLTDAPFELTDGGFELMTDGNDTKKGWVRRKLEIKNRVNPNNAQAVFYTSRSTIQTKHRIDSVKHQNHPRLAKQRLMNTHVWIE
jgi:hypothetical protein